ncbi:hypothetical protein D3C84_589640 [compost metagenome]
MKPCGKITDRRCCCRRGRGPVQGLFLPVDIGLDHILDVILVTDLIGGLGQEIRGGNDNLDQVPIWKGAIVPIQSHKPASINIGTTGRHGQRAVIALSTGIERCIVAGKTPPRTIEMILAAACAERWLVIAADGPGLLALLCTYFPVELVGGSTVGLTRQRGTQG